MVIEEQVSGPVNNENTHNIPFSLRELGEIPEGFVPVFIVINRESMDHIANNGFRTQDNRGNARNQQAEELFQQSAQEHDMTVFDRTKCVFAYPRHPSRIGYGLGYEEDKHVIIEAYIDPKTALVANGDNFSEAATRLEYNKNVRSAKDYADSYWENAKPLEQYVQEGHAGQMDDYDDFTFPEVLIMDDIPTSRLKVNLDRPSPEDEQEDRVEIETAEDNN